MEGRVSSVQSMGAVDGPGLRYVVDRKSVV